MDQEPSTPSGVSLGLMDALIAVVKNFTGLMMNRMELAALEFSEVRANFFRISLFFAVWIVALWFAIAYWSVLIVALTWESLGWKILLILAAVFTVLAIGIYLHMTSMLAQGQLSMPTTMAELRSDRDALL